MKPQILTREGFTVVGVKAQGAPSSHNFAALWQEFMPRAAEIRHLAAGSAAYGICLSSGEAACEFDYVAGLEVDRVLDLPSGMGSWTLSQQTYARFSTTLPDIRETWRFILEEWLPGSEYERARAPDFEEYGEAFDAEDPDSELFLYIPIEPRK